MKHYVIFTCISYLGMLSCICPPFPEIHLNVNTYLPERSEAERERERMFVCVRARVLFCEVEF